MKRVLVLLAGILLLPQAGPSAAQEPLGRLFFSAEQRAALDARRRLRLPDQPGAAMASPNTRLDGYVKRSDGKSTVWVNGRPIPEAVPNAPRIGQPGDARVSVPVGDTRARVGLKPGETLDQGTGAVRDVIGDGEIRVRSTK